MNAILMLALLVSAPDVQVMAVPDQPIPHVYVDDPVILELTAARDIACNVNVTVRPEGVEAFELPSIPITLRAGSPRWHVLEGIPVTRGLHTVGVELDAGGAVTKQEVTFCRVDRPVTDGEIPVVAAIHKAGPGTLLAVRGLPLGQVCIDAAQPDAEQLIQLAREAELGVSMMLDVEQLPEAEAAVGRLTSALGELPVLWGIDPAGSAPQLQSAIEAVQRAAARSSVMLAVPDAETLRGLLRAGAGRAISGLALRAHVPGADELPALRDVAESAGYEGFSMYALTRHGDRAPQTGVDLVSQVVRNTAAGASWTALDMQDLYDGSQFRDGYVHVSALAHQLAGTVYVGKLALPSPAAAHVFRAGQSWVLVLWTSSGCEVRLNLSGATDVAMTDGRNNPLPAPEVIDEASSVAVGPGVVYLRGKGGTLIGDASRAMARREAGRFVSNEDFARLLPPELLATIRQIASDDAAKPARLDFLALLKAFPLIEEQWHIGALPRNIAVPAIAGLQRVMRHLSVLEEEIGEPFVDPAQEYLANCRMYCSKYLTNSGGANRPPERGESILDVVELLTADAEALVAAGRVTEATGVASVAEWRARSLQFAEKEHPLSEPEQPPVAMPAEDSVPSEEGSGEAANPGTAEEPAQPDSSGDADGETPADLPQEPDEGAETEPPQPSESETEPVSENTAAGQTGETPSAESDDEQVSDSEKEIIHVVKRGDNPWALGQKYGVDHKKIYEWNGWKRGHVLNVGDKVTIRKKE